jgi:hypothetical protein
VYDSIVYLAYLRFLGTHLILVAKVITFGSFDTLVVAGLRNGGFSGVMTEFGACGFLARWHPVSLLI